MNDIKIVALVFVLVFALGWVLATDRCQGHSTNFVPDISTHTHEAE